MLLYLWAMKYTCAQVWIPAFSAGIKMIHTCGKKDASVSFTAKRLSSLFKCAHSGDPVTCYAMQRTYARQKIAAIHSLFFKCQRMTRIPRLTRAPQHWFN